MEHVDLEHNICLYQIRMNQISIFNMKEDVKKLGHDLKNIYKWELTESTENTRS